MATTLLLLDAQVNLFDPRYPVYDSVSLLQRLVALLDRARHAGMPVIYVQHDGGLGAIDEQGAPGFEIQGELAPLPGDSVEVKRTPSAFHETTLHAELDRLGVTALVVAGMQSELCIEATCRAAVAFGFTITLVADTHSTFDAQGESAPQIIARLNRELAYLVAVKAT